MRANLPTKFGNNHNFYGSVVGGNTKDGYDVKFDLLPSSEELDNDGVMKPNNVMYGFSRQKLAIHDIDEAEVAYDREPPSEAEEDSATKRTPYGRSVDEFCKLPASDLKDARSFSMKFGAAPSDSITWEILEDAKPIIVDASWKVPTGPDLRKELDFDNCELDVIFSDHIFPDVTGHGKVIDEILSDRRCKYHDTAKNDSIKFRCPFNMDYKAKQ